MEAFLKAFALGGADSSAEADAQATPGFSDHDAVAGVLGVVADLDGEIDAEMADVLRKTGYILEAFVADSGDFVLIAEDVGGRIFGAEIRLGAAVGTIKAGVDERGIGNATARGEELAALTLYLFCGGPTVVEDVRRDATGGDYAKGDCANLVGTEMQR